jgi:hypothetical protein
MKRPGIITFICIFGFIYVILTFPQVFSPPVKRLGIFIPALYGVLVAAHFMACVGLWYYKQWGVRLYFLAFFARTLFFILTGQTGTGFYVNIAITVAFSVFLLRHYPRMNANL